MKNQPKPGSSVKAAQKLGGKGDFGVPESDVAERTYTSENTKHSDPGGAQSRGGSQSRESGVGAPAAGPGSSSGGDLSPDFTGVGTGGGISQNGVDKNYRGGPDEAQQFTHRHPSQKSAPPQNLNTPGQHQSTVSRTPDDASNSSQGADAATNPAARQDDSFASEISSDEASGQQT